MRVTTFTLFVALASWVEDALADDSKIQVEVRYSDTYIDVGDLDLFAETWQKIYAADGNGHSVVTDKTFGTNSSECTSWADGPALNVQVKIDGRWGQISDVGPNDSREALVTSLWAVLNEVSNSTGWHVFSNCYGTTWQEGVPLWDGPHACGGQNATVMEECLCDIGSAQCEKHTWGHKVPSIIQANLYRNGTLLPDMLTVEFASQSTQTKGACNQAEFIGGNLVSLVPVAGPFFAVGVFVFCILDP